MKLDPPEPEPADEPDLTAAQSAIPEELAAEPVDVPFARRQLATYIRGLEGDVPRGIRPYTYANPRRLEHDSSGVVSDNAFEIVSKLTVVYRRIHNSVDDRVKREHQNGAQVFHALLAGD